MTTTQVFQIFDILQDKYGAPYFDPSWKVELFNMAQYQYLNDLIPEDGGKINFDFDQNVTASIQPLIWPVTLSTNSTGLLAEAAINTALRTASGDSTAELFRILAIRIPVGSATYPVQYIKYNNIGAFQANVFKAPTSPKGIRFTFVGNGLQFYPSTTTNNLSISVIKTPRKIAISPNVDPEWSDYVCYNLIVKMLKEASIVTNSEEVLQEVRMAAIAG